MLLMAGLLCDWQVAMPGACACNPRPDRALALHQLSSRAVQSLQRCRALPASSCRCCVTAQSANQI